MQGSPSLFSGFEHVPFFGSHVPGSWHSSFGGHEVRVPGVQEPVPQWSPTVQRSSSLQSVPVVFVCTQPTPGSQVSVVHGSVSAQSSGVPPPHVPFVQTCPWMHLFPVSQGVSFVAFACVQAPVVRSHPSVVHGFVSLQFGPDVATHSPLWQ